VSRIAEVEMECEWKLEFDISAFSEPVSVLGVHPERFSHREL
jgi:hypothetical protein